MFAGEGKAREERKRGEAGWGPNTEFWVLQNDKDPPPMRYRGDPRWCTHTETDLTYKVLRKLQFELTHLICVITHRNKSFIRNQSRATNEAATLGHWDFLKYSLLSLTQLFQKFFKVFRTLHLPGSSEVRDFALHIRLQVFVNEGELSGPNAVSALPSLRVLLKNAPAVLFEPVLGV